MPGPDQIRGRVPTDQVRGGPIGFLFRHRWATVIVVCAVAVAATVPSLIGGGSTPQAIAADRNLTSLAQVTSGSFYLFRSTNLDHYYGRLAAAPTTDPDGQRALTTLSCARVSYAGGRGVCVSSSQGLFQTAKAVIFNHAFSTLATIPLQGFPNRAQVSADGRYAAVTDFVNGDSYASAAFSTRTDIIDLQSDRILFDLEKLHVTRNGHPFSNVNFNFWGVTFAHDDQHFYATLGSGSATYLIEGDISTMQAQVLTTGVECPSLSPDGTRIAFKQRLPGSTVRWRLSVLDLATLQRHPLAETGSVDDQPYWIDNSTVAYGLAVGGDGSGTSNGITALTAGGSIPTDMWAVPADGSGAPRLLAQGAWSAVLVP